MKNPFSLFFTLIALVGIACLVVGIVVYEKDKIPSGYVSTTGRITKVQPIYHPARSCPGPYCTQTPAYYTYNGIISFKVKGIDYTFISNYGSPPFQGQAPQAGSRISVDYNSNNPSQKPIDTSNKLNKDLGQILFVIGAVIIVFGSILLIIKARK